MNVILFTKKFDKNGERLEKKLHDTLTDVNVKVDYSLHDILKSLRKSVTNSTVVLLHAFSHDILDSFLLIRKQLERIRVILILPDEEDDSFAKGHLLRPRYISTVNCDFNNISAVLNKMENSSQQ